MSKICFVTGKTRMTGNTVSHSNNKNKRVFNANIQKRLIISEVLGPCRLHLTSNGYRTIEKFGGLDAFLQNTNVIYGDEGKELIKKYYANLSVNL